MSKQASTAARPQSEDGGSSNSDAQPAPVMAAWRPTYRKRLPLLGLTALAGVLLCTAAAVGVLVGSNNMSSTKWVKQLAPNVCLSAINSVSDVLLALAMSQGVAIAWWRKVSYDAVN